MKKIKIAILFTCFNRKKITLRTVRHFDLYRSLYQLSFYIVDDLSSDNTVEELKKLNIKKINMFQTKGNYYYSKSMSLGMKKILDSHDVFDYLLIINDDVNFNDFFLNKMVLFQQKNNCITIGACCDSSYKLSYGGIKFKSMFSTKYEMIGPNKSSVSCDTFNGNCVLIPYEWFQQIGPMDSFYSHSFGDFDFGLQFKKNHFPMHVMNEYVGICNRNEKKNTWLDSKLSILKRIKLKESPKGSPFLSTFYFYSKNFNVFFAIKCSLFQYFRILLKK